MRVPVAVSPGPSSKCRAKPKSEILGVPSTASRMLAGFKSRWTMPFACAACTAPVRAATSSAASRVGSGVPASFSARVPPSTNSIVKYARPPASPLSYTWTTFGCRRAATATASRWNRARSRGLAYVAGEDHLEGHGAVQLPVAGAIHDPHPAPADHGFHLVLLDPG